VSRRNRGRDLNEKSPVGISATTFYEFALNSSEREYADLLDNWKWIDAKAQATGVISGVFIAASFAYMKNTDFVLNGIEKAVLVAVLVSLIAAIGFAVLAMHVRDLDGRPMGAEESRSRAEDAAGRPEDEHDERYLALLRLNVDAWVDVNRGFRDGVAEKANRLRMAQAFLLVAVAAVTLLVGVTVVRM
jgi:uncharacterized membrane protein